MECIDIGYTSKVFMYITHLQMDYCSFFLACCFHIGIFLQSYWKYGK